MELEDDGKLRSALDIALGRFQGSSEADRKKVVVDEDSTYDERFFVPLDDLTNTDLDDSEEEKVIHSAEVVSNVTREELEDLTMPSLPGPELGDFPVACHYRGPLFDFGGYARMNRTFIFGLSDMGSLIKVDPLDSINNVNQRTEQALLEMKRNPVPPDYPKIYGMTIPSLLAHGGRKILYTMMETSMKLHPEYAERLCLSDEIWVPSSWCKEVFEASGVSSDIRVMPLGVDTRRYRPALEPLKFGGSENLRSFRFLSVFGWSYRKGFDVLIRAFLEEFSNKDDVSLILSTRFAGTTEEKSHRRILDDFNQVRAMVPKEDHEMPHIALHSAYTPEKDMPHLYNAAHCFILISRGEGFGLPYCEAGACGLPVIASDHGGQRDFLDDETAYLVPPDGYRETKRTDPPFQNLAWISHFYEDQKFPTYEEKALQLTRQHMRHVYENYSEASIKGNRLKDRMRNEFDWSISIKKVYGRLVEICDDIRRG